MFNLVCVQRLPHCVATTKITPHLGTVGISVVLCHATLDHCISCTATIINVVLDRVS